MARGGIHSGWGCNVRHGYGDLVKFVSERERALARSEGELRTVGERETSVAGQRWLEGSYDNIGTQRRKATGERVKGDPQGREKDVRELDWLAMSCEGDNG